MFIDTHCHLNFKDYKDDSLVVASNALKENVFMVVVGSEFKTSQRAVELAKGFDKGVYCAIGLHPIHTQDILVKNDNENGKYEFHSRAEDFIEANYQELVNLSPKIVAIGEIGLDYYHLDAPDQESEIKAKNRQKQVFIKQLEFALKNKLPVIIHCREAHDDLYEILANFRKNNDLSKNWGVIHCFSGDYNWAQKYFDLGLKISFTGLITFVRDFDDVIRRSPLENIMIETDSPYLSPIPYRGQRNNPVWVKEVAKRIAEIKELSLTEVEELLWKNSLDFFNIKA